MERPLSLLIIFFFCLNTPSQAQTIDAEINSTIHAARFSDAIFGKFGKKVWDCYTINQVSLENNGILTLRFGKYGLGNCKSSKIYDVQTLPPNQVVGVRGFEGIKAKDEFFIQVSPDTRKITLTLDFGIPKEARYDISELVGTIKSIQAAETGTPSWMKGWQNTESKLIAAAEEDKTPPSIQVTTPNPANGKITRVDTYTSFIRGSITDDAGVMTILVAGRKVGVEENGQFAAKVKLALGRNDILIQAEDVNGNVAEQTVTLIRKEFIAEDVLADVDLPPKTKMSNPDALAVVIGVESYQYVPDATYAYNDAEVFREYLAETLGMKRQRVKLATNSKATQAEFSKLLGPNGWLARNIVQGKSDVVVYFSGHGIASPDAKSSGLLPFDVDPNYAIGLPLEQLYADLSGMGARSVTVFLDACFTGQTRDETMLIANARPIVVRPAQEAIPSNISVVSAASGSQISGALKDKEHGLFTYYLLKGMGGDADVNKDRFVTLGEIESFVSTKVREQAALDGREQTPQLQGNSNNVLVVYE